MVETKNREVTSLAIPLPGATVARVFKAALTALVENIEPTSENLENILIMRGLYREVSEATEARRQKLYEGFEDPGYISREVFNTYGLPSYAADQAEDALHKELAASGGSRTEAAHRIARRFQDDMIEAGLDPEAIGDAMEACRARGDKAACVRIVSRVSAAVATHRAKKGETR